MFARYFISIPYNGVLASQIREAQVTTDRGQSDIMSGTSVT